MKLPKRITFLDTDALMAWNLSHLKAHSHVVWKYWQKVEAAIRLREDE